MNAFFSHMYGKVRESSVLSSIFHFSVLAMLWSYFLVPYFPTHSPIIFGKSFFITQILMVVAAVIGLVYCVRRLSDLKANTGLTKVILISFSLFILTIVGSTLVAHGWSLAFFSKALSVVSIVLVCGICSLLERRWVSILCVSIAAFSIVSAILGFMQFFFFGDAAALAAVLGTPYSVFYAVGFANYPSLFAISLGFFMPFALYFFVTGYLRVHWLWLLSFVLGGIGILLSLSRSALIATSIGVVVMVVWLYRERTKRKMTLIALLALVFFGGATFFFVPPPGTQFSLVQHEHSVQDIFEHRFVVFSIILNPTHEENSEEEGVASSTIEQIQQQDRSAYSRYIFHTVGLSMLQSSFDNFLFGYGVSGFTDNWDLFRADFPAQNDIDPHSTFLEVAVASGLVGFLFFLLFLAALAWALWKLRGDSFVPPLLVSLMIFLIDGLAHTHLYTKYFWIVIGLSLGVVLFKAPEQKEVSL